MFKLTHELPKKLLVAVSGGVDSVAALHWLWMTRWRVQGIVHVDHGTPFGAAARDFVADLAEKYDVELYSYRIEGTPEKGQSLEDFWRIKRYEKFDLARRETGLKFPIVTAHNFNDCLEEYIMCTMVRGYQGNMPYSHGFGDAVVKPFRLWKRQDIENYAKRYSLQYLEDPANDDFKYLRTRIRKVIVPEILTLNPGIWGIVEQSILRQDRYDGNIGILEDAANYGDDED